MSEDLTYLEALAADLVAAGLACRTVLNDPPVRLRVTWHDMPVIGEAITVVPAPPGGDEGRWFRCSLGTLLGPCHRPAETAVLVLDCMRHFIPRVAAGR